MVPHHVYLPVGDWGMKHWNKVVSYIGGHGAVGAVSDMCFISVVSVESVNRRGWYLMSVAPYVACINVYACVNACVNACSQCMRKWVYQMSVERIFASLQYYEHHWETCLRTISVSSKQSACLQINQRVFRTLSVASELLTGLQNGRRNGAI